MVIFLFALSFTNIYLNAMESDHTLTINLIASTANQLADSYKFSKNLDAAVKYYAIAATQNVYLDTKIHALKQLGKIFHSRGQKGKAFVVLHHAKKYKKQMDEYTRIAVYDIALALSAYHKKDYTTAKELFETTLSKNISGNLDHLDTLLYFYYARTLEDQEAPEIYQAKEYHIKVLQSGNQNPLPAAKKFVEDSLQRLVELTPGIYDDPISEKIIH
jgi:tetratricopeptide (TPR) repeat protein